MSKSGGARLEFIEWSGTGLDEEERHAIVRLVNEGRRAESGPLCKFKSYGLYVSSIEAPAGRVCGCCAGAICVVSTERTRTGKDAGAIASRLWGAPGPYRVGASGEHGRSLAHEPHTRFGPNGALPADEYETHVAARKRVAPPPPLRLQLEDLAREMGGDPHTAWPRAIEAYRDSLMAVGASASAVDAILAEIATLPLPVRMEDLLRVRRKHLKAERKAQRPAGPPQCLVCSEPAAPVIAGTGGLRCWECYARESWEEASQLREHLRIADAQLENVTAARDALERRALLAEEEVEHLRGPREPLETMFSLSAGEIATLAEDGEVTKNVCGRIVTVRKARAESFDDEAGAEECETTPSGVVRIDHPASKIRGTMGPGWPDPAFEKHVGIAPMHEDADGL
ncbi:MAG TPA: hypothetical protein VD948_02885 [Rhodothermales bacterium]|nr:hypothetical protein [Rhodothermales bacterium]